MSDLCHLATAVINSNPIDITGALAMADYLQDYGDGRGDRLRRRVRRYEKDVAATKANHWWLIKNAGLPDRELSYALYRLRDTFVHYVIRLLSVHSGAKLPPRRVTTGGYGHVEPGG